VAKDRSESVSEEEHSISEQEDSTSPDDLTRRTFVAEGSKLAVGAMIVPRHVLGGPGRQAPSETLSLAVVGAGGMGTENAQELGTENIIAVCDVDHGLVARKVE